MGFRTPVRYATYMDLVIGHDGSGL
jgi:hypothetical protein